MSGEVFGKKKMQGKTGSKWVVKGNETTYLWSDTFKIVYAQRT